MAGTAGFAELHVLMLLVADGTDAGRAVDIEHPDFAAGHANLSVFSLFCHQLSAVAGTADKLGAAARIELNSMYCAADRNVLERQAIACFNWHFFTGLYR